MRQQTRKQKYLSNRLRQFTIQKDLYGCGMETYYSRDELLRKTLYEQCKEQEGEGPEIAELFSSET